MRHVQLIILFILLLLCATNANAYARGGIATQKAPVSGAGVAVSGLEYPWVESAPSAADLDYIKARGANFIRLAFAWEKIQPTLNAPLNAAFLTLLKDFLTLCNTKGIRVILDMHNYGRYNPAGLGDSSGPSTSIATYIGTTEVPISAFADVWRRIALELKDYPAAAGYGLMNEPHDMGSFDNWKAAAQAAVDAIRGVDKKTTIYAGGYGWSSAKYWTAFQTYAGVNDNFLLEDKTGNLVYEAHIYFDNGGGSYALSYDDSGATATRGVEWSEPFVSWCNLHRVKCFIGEYGAPKNDLRWQTLITNFLNYLRTNNISSTWWMYTYDDGEPTWWPINPGTNGGYLLNLLLYQNESQNPFWSILSNYWGV